jgi:tetratricopeptide (TPR) repeat protein
MNRGYQADYVSTDTPEHDYSEKLIDEAIKAFDHYLELRDSKSVRSDRALCKYYKDDINGATADVEKLTEDYPDYALAWANLGMLYEGKAEDEKATEAYKKAVELDPDNVSGAKSFAGERIIAINPSVSSLADASDASADKLEKTEPSSTGLTDALKTDTGLGF